MVFTSMPASTCPPASAEARLDRPCSAHQAHGLHIDLVFVRGEFDLVMNGAADLDDADGVVGHVLERFEAGVPGMVRGENGAAVEARHLAPLAADDFQSAFGGEIVGGRRCRRGAEIEIAGDDALRHGLRGIEADGFGVRFSAAK